MLKTLNDVSEHEFYAFTCLIVDKKDESGRGRCVEAGRGFLRGETRLLDYLYYSYFFLLYINNATQTSCYHLSSDFFQICAQENLDLVIFHLICISLM